MRSQVAVNTDNISRLFDELGHVRGRLHTVESDRATVLLLAQKVDDLSRQLPLMVERAANVAAERVAEEHSGDLRTTAALLGSIVAVLGFLFTLSLHLYG